MSQLINILQNLNANISFRSKTINIDAVLISLSELEQLLKLKYPQSPYKTEAIIDAESKFILNIENGKYKFNYCIFMYVENYTHLTDDKKERAELKKIALKLCDKYNGYFKKYNRTH